MEGETITFGGSLVVLTIGLVILLAGVFLGPVTELLVIGGLVAVAAVMWLAASA